MDLSSIPTGVLIFAGIALVVAVFCHLYLHRFWRASLLSAVAAPALFLLASTVQERGLPEPLTIAAFALFAAFSLLISIIVGLVTGLARRIRLVGA
ncbi:hypothetical protein WCE55_02500 [Luteimonas sp. MJ293]|uniref:hypothetical protein n=1 Tax=Luteimonas sp. MJ146 TaxID=3129240 RepID=UPI0031BAC330